MGEEDGGECGGQERASGNVDPKQNPQIANSSFAAAGIFLAGRWEWESGDEESVLLMQWGRLCMYLHKLVCEGTTEQHPSREKIALAVVGAGLFSVFLVPSANQRCQKKGRWRGRGGPGGLGVC